MYICMGDLTTIGSDNGLSSGQRQSIIWTTFGIFIIGPLGTNFNEIIIKIQKRRNTRHFEDDIFKYIFLNENVWISNTTWLKFVPKGPVDNNRALDQIMAWHRTGAKPLYEPMMD